MVLLRFGCEIHDGFHSSLLRLLSKGHHVTKPLGDTHVERSRFLTTAERVTQRGKQWFFQG